MDNYGDTSRRSTPYSSAGGELYSLESPTYTNSESVANRVWANRMAVFTRVFPRAAQNPPKKFKIKSAGFLQFFENFLPPTKKLKINPKKYLTFLKYRFILCGLSKLGRVQERKILTSGTRKFRNIVNKSSSSKFKKGCADS